VKKPITATDKRLEGVNTMAEGQAKFQSCSTKFATMKLPTGIEN
jgi:hypothetical protein